MLLRDPILLLDTAGGGGGGFPLYGSQFVFLSGTLHPSAQVSLRYERRHAHTHLVCRSLVFWNLLTPASFALDALSFNSATNGTAYEVV